MSKQYTAKDIGIVIKHSYSKGIEGFTVIEEIINPLGKFELLEDNFYGDIIPAIVLLNGEIVGDTFDYLGSFVFDFMEDLGLDPCK